MEGDDLTHVVAPHLHHNQAARRDGGHHGAGAHGVGLIGENAARDQGHGNKDECQRNDGTEDADDAVLHERAFPERSKDPNHAFGERGSGR